MKFPVALQLYSVRDFVQKDFAETLKQLASFGYDGVEFAGLYGHDPQEVRDLCVRYGLTPISAHVPYKDLMADAQGTMEQYKMIGCKYIVVPHIGSEYCAGQPKFAEFTESLRYLGAVANRLGLRLGYHNHDFEFSNRIGEEYMLDALYRLVPESLLLTQLDTCWVKVGGEDPAEYLRKYAGRCPTVHLKDFVGQKTEHMYALIGVQDDAEKKAAQNTQFCLMPVGYGVQNFPEILEAAHEAGSEWIVVEQDSPSMGKTSLECAKLSMDYLKTINQ